MNRRLAAIIVLFVLSGPALAQIEARGPIVSLAQFQAELQTLDSRVGDLAVHPQNAESLRKVLPKYWTVIGGRLPVDVSTDFLDRALTDFQKEGPPQKKVILKELHTQLVVMRAGVDGYTRPEVVDQAMRKRLDDILAAREFSSVHGPSVWDKIIAWVRKWTDPIAAWFRDWWEKHFGDMHLSTPNFNWFGRVYVWLVIAAAACVLGVWLYRLYRRKPVEVMREIMPFAPSAKSWRIWLNEAKAHAEKHEWREAIHLSYWAGVSYLEASGLWIPDRARTPREYLREINNHDPKKQPFLSLTHRFENVWYGSRKANPDDFDSALNELEKLGCQ